MSDLTSYPKRNFLDFENDLKIKYERLAKLSQKKTATQAESKTAITIQDVERQLAECRKSLTKSLTNWQRVQLSRHPDRPYTKKYIELIFSDFIEMAGDRNFADDKAVISGLATLQNETVLVVGQQKGYTTKGRQMRNFGMMHPEGYRKALRLFKFAEKFNKPIICFIDTPGAYPAPEAEDRGQGEAIARNIIEMIGLQVPVICVIIGEGASGGAMGIGVGDVTYMLENTWFTVISPESCSSILWKSWDYKEIAAEQLRLSAKEMKQMKLIDDIIKEPAGGAHWDYPLASKYIKKKLVETLSSLKKISPAQRVKNRINRYYSYGIYKTEKAKS